MRRARLRAGAALLVVAGGFGLAGCSGRGAAGAGSTTATSTAVTTTTTRPAGSTSSAPAGHGGGLPPAAPALSPASLAQIDQLLQQLGTSISEVDSDLANPQGDG